MTSESTKRLTHTHKVGEMALALLDRQTGERNSPRSPEMRLVKLGNDSAADQRRQAGGFSMRKTHGRSSRTRHQS